MLEELRKIAIRFQIDPISTIGHAAKLESVIKVLTDLNKSYKNFLQIEFLKNENFCTAYKKNDKLLDAFIEELELLIVDVKFDSFAPAVAPNLTEESTPIFTNEVLAWKKEKFDEYREDIFKADFRDPAYIQRLSKRYSDDERSKIFQPLFSSTGDGKSYKLNILDVDYKLDKVFIQPEKEKIPFYIPKPEKIKTEPQYKNIQAFMRVKSDEDGKIDLKKSTIKETFYLEELPYDTYPFKPRTVQYEGLLYILNDKLDCEVEYEDGSYIIRNDLFDITVWGDTRDEAEDAFNFSFNALYQNFALEKDDILTNEALELKSKLLSAVKKLINSNEA